MNKTWWLLPRDVYRRSSRGLRWFPVDRRKDLWSCWCQLVASTPRLVLTWTLLHVAELSPGSPCSEMRSGTASVQRPRSVSEAGLKDRRCSSPCPCPGLQWWWSRCGPDLDLSRSGSGLTTDYSGTPRSLSRRYFWTTQQLQHLFILEYIRLAIAMTIMIINE